MPFIVRYTETGNGYRVVPGVFDDFFGRRGNYLHLSRMVVFREQFALANTHLHFYITTTDRIDRITPVKAGLKYGDTIYK